MGKKCFVPGCVSGYKSNVQERIEKNLPPISLFHPPEGALKLWGDKIPRADFPLTTSDSVCELHFEPEEVKSEFEVLKMPDGTEIREERSKKKLVEGAFPHIFPNCPFYLTKRIKKRKAPTVRYGTGKRKEGEKKIFKVPLIPENPPLHTEAAPPDMIERESVPKEQDITLLNSIHDHPETVPLPSKMWAVFQDKKETNFAHLASDKTIDKCITFAKGEAVPQLTIYGKSKNIPASINSVQNLVTYLNETNDLRLCSGSGMNKQRHKQCSLTVPGLRATRCKACKALRKQIRKQSKRKLVLLAKRKRKAKAKATKMHRLEKKVKSLKAQIKAQIKEMRNFDNDLAEKLIQQTEEKHREVVKACIMSAKVKNKKNRRYTQEWMYNCILMRIKSGGLYRKMLRDDTLPLPCLRTIQRYIKKIRPAFGFNPGLFQLMSEKSQHLSESEKHGCLLVDEMALDEAVAFDKSTLEVHGMVDLGDASPEDADTTLGNHALVVMFQPFQGQWFQALGAFCSRGAAKGPQLEKIITEAILLLEKSGFKVDEVTTDGGSWNRNMWKLFGISEDKPSCRHPATLDGPARKLRFCSDFPHLIKCMWRRVLSAEILETPDGIVKLSHWQALVKHDSMLRKQINICYQLTEDHLEPTNYQLMKVKLAFQFFSENVARAMEYYRDVCEVPELADCAPTVKFIRRVHGLIQAMNSRNRWDSLRNSDDNESKKEIQEFLSFLNNWKNEVKDPELRLTPETQLGLFVTLKGTLELVEYLSVEVGYEYLMTRRLNQDALEHFFGKIREACGSSSHPDPQHFIQVFRLLQTASLIKPPRGSNVTGGDMLRSLTNLSDLFNNGDKERRVLLEEQLDQILDSGDEEGLLQGLLDQNNNQHEEHTYQYNCLIDEFAFQMFAGYVARKTRQMSHARSCEDCFKSLTKPDDQPVKESQSLIEKRSRGFLLIASDALYDILHKAEEAILKVTSKAQLHRHILFEVLDELKSTSIHSTVGCVAHQREMTKAVLTFFLTTRMFFVCKRHMKKITSLQAKKKKAKALAKQYKLNALSGSENVEQPDSVQTSQVPKRQKKRKNNTISSTFDTDEQEDILLSQVLDDCIIDLDLLEQQHQLHQTPEDLDHLKNNKDNSTENQKDDNDQSLTHQMETEKEPQNSPTQRQLEHSCHQQNSKTTNKLQPKTNKQIKVTENADKTQTNSKKRKRSPKGETGGPANKSPKTSSKASPKKQEAPISRRNSTRNRAPPVWRTKDFVPL